MIILSGAVLFTYCITDNYVEPYRWFFTVFFLIFFSLRYKSEFKDKQ